jgi:hypothetical protein
MNRTGCHSCHSGGRPATDHFNYKQHLLHIMYRALLTCNACSATAWKRGLGSGARATLPNTGGGEQPAVLAVQHLPQGQGGPHTTEAAPRLLGSRSGIRWKTYGGAQQ